MKIAVIGAAGKAGSLIAKEALDRGHEVTAIVKPGSEDRVPKGCAVLAKSLFDLTSADLKGFAAVVNAFGTPYDVPGKEKEHIDAAKLLIAIGRELPDVRFLTIGGYGSLFTDETKTKRVVDGYMAVNGVPRANTYKLVNDTPYVISYGTTSNAYAGAVLQDRDCNAGGGIMFEQIAFDYPLTAAEREALRASAAVLETHTRLARQILAGL